jgi:iron complex outermembrane receptor protein
VELELIMALTDNLRVRAAYGYLDAEYDKYIGLDDDGNPEDRSDRKLRRAPKNTFGASLTYSANVGEGEIIGDLSYRWRDDFEVIANNDPVGHVDAYGILDASVDYIYHQRYQISVYGRNLDDERVQSVTKIGTLSSFGTWNQPRNWGVELRYNFGSGY